MQPLYEYVCHMKGHRNSKGELAEWVIKSHETGKILSSHKSEQKAKEHLQQMHIFNEAAENAGYPKLYHICGYMTGLTDDDLRSILTNGLRIHDNGEANCIWFSTGKTFIDDIVKAPLIVSLECTPENIKKYRIDEFEVRNQSGAINVHENVPMEDLNIEQLMWGRTNKGEGTRIYPLTSTKYYGNFERWQRFDKDLQAIIYEDLFNMWARDDIARQGFNPDLNRLKEIMGDRLTITNFMEPKSYKLIGESTYGNDMDKRIKIFMEGVSQLGLSKNQVDAIGKITNVCMEGISDEPTEELNSPELGKNDLGKICTYDVNDETPVVQVLSQNVPLQELTKHRENLLHAAPICKVTSDIEKYSMISPYDKITDTAMQYMQGEISFDPSDDGNVYGFKWTCLGRPSICFWMPNDLDYSGYDDAGKIGDNEEEPAEF